MGIVTSTDHKTGANFVDVEVEPSAQMNKSKHLLLVFDGRKTDGQSKNLFKYVFFSAIIAIVLQLVPVNDYFAYLKPNFLLLMNLG